MSGLERAVSWFVEPAAPEAAAPPMARPGARAAVLGRPGRAEPVAAALALALRDRERARACVVALLAREASDVSADTARERPAGAATGAARRLAAHLDARGIEAVARGRLAWAHLPVAPVQAAAAARRAASLGAPAVLAVTAPRSEAVDDLLAEQDLLVIVAPDPDGPLAALATGGLGVVPAAAVAAPPLPAGPRRALALAGVAAGPAGHRLAAALGTSREPAW